MIIFFQVMNGLLIFLICFFPEQIISLTKFKILLCVLRNLLPISKFWRYSPLFYWRRMLQSISNYFWKLRLKFSFPYRYTTIPKSVVEKTVLFHSCFWCLCQKPTDCISMGHLLDRYSISLIYNVFLTSISHCLD